MLKKMKLILVVISVFFTFSSLAYAYEDRIFVLQTVLNDHGFDAGEPDGKVGPRTREAAAAMGQKYGMPESPDELINAIISRNASNSKWLDDEALEEVRNGVGELLKDPSSAQVRKVRIVEGHSGPFLCGEVNGKNSYGAYAGFTQFRSLGVTNVLFKTYADLLYYIEQPDSSFIFWTCLLEIPVQN